MSFSYLKFTLFLTLSVTIEYNEWIDGWIDGWTDRRKGDGKEQDGTRWMDGWMGGWMDINSRLNISWFSLCVAAISIVNLP